MTFEKTLEDGLGPCYKKLATFEEGVSKMMRMLMEERKKKKMIWALALKSWTKLDGQHKTQCVSKIMRMLMEEKNDMGACIEKLDKVGWAAQDPMYDTALLLFGQSADYRQLWLHLKPESCRNWAKSALHEVGIWLCGECFCTHTFSKNCKHVNGVVVPAPSFDEVAINGIHVPSRPYLSVIDSTLGTLPIDDVVVDGAIFKVPLLGVESIRFDINLLNRLGLVSDQLADSTPSFSRVKKSSKHDQANVVQCKCKMGDGYFTAAIKVLMSSGVALSTPDTLHELEAKHLYAPPMTLSSSPLGVDALSVYKDLVLNRIRSFPKGTLCSHDGLRAQHLMDILGGDAFAIVDDLLGSITGAVNMFLSGKCPSILGEYIAGVPLTLLVKPVGVNRLIEPKGNEVGLSMLLVDFKNAFNLVDMIVLLEETRVSCPSIAPWVEFYYAQSARLYYDDSILWSCQETINQSCELTLQAWYLDDCTIVGYTLMVAKALDIIKTNGLTRGLFLNVDTTELFCPVEDPRSKAEGVFPLNISRPLNGVKLLGRSVQFDHALRATLKKVVTASGPGFGDWKWQIATLPIKLGGLGILLAGDIIQYAFLASRLQTSALQANILMKTGTESHGSSFQHALDAFITTCNVDVLSITTCTPAPQMMKTLAKCYFGFIEKDLISKLAVPMFSEGSLSPSCNVHRMDQCGDHVVHCSGEVGVKFRHNLVRDILVDICSKVGTMVRKEAPMGFLSDDGEGSTTYRPFSF
uniref:Reverse transcriptase domain-containing protein n=1 Tax=Tanacetum cinerariifolium TaxID=118510 RepID=A0A699IXI7_TANCI|nr:hypothetical protein [Tanacetum cinerariifolium]